MLSDAFNLLLTTHRRSVLIGRPGNATLPCYITPANYFRSFNGPSESVYSGREFIISKAVLSGISHSLRRGDTIVDADMGHLTVDEVREMYDLGGSIMGYRIRTN